ncbi:MAG: serine protein kinase RIO [Nanobdellota archaeon]
MSKITREKFKTFGNVFDEFTLRNLFRLESQGHFQELKSPVQIGKEANIFSARTKDKDIIVKIYRLETCDFKRMYDYIKHDMRYINLKRSRRQIIFSWTQREYRNILKAREVGVRVPTPIVFRDNIILMEQIGSPDPAPQLKDAYPEKPEEFFEKIIQYMRLLWQDARLVHGDLSQFNILNDRKPVFIDFSQSLTTESMVAKEYLRRDIKNVITFFKKLNLHSDEEETFRYITKPN